MRRRLLVDKMSEAVAEIAHPGDGLRGYRRFRIAVSNSVEGWLQR